MRLSSPLICSPLVSNKSTRATTVYAPLVANTTRSEEDLPLHNHDQFKQSKKHVLKKLITSGLILLFGVFLGIAVERLPQDIVEIPGTESLKKPLYSPAQDAVRYGVRHYDVSLEADSTGYQGFPTEEIDNNWKDLYRYGMSRITASEADKLVDKTTPIPGDDHYIVTLEIYHQLHCLNLIRQSLYPDYYSTISIDHLVHCVDFLRVGLTCNVDINPLPWQWSEAYNLSLPKFDGAHNCVDFEKIQEWAFEHRLQTVFDESVNLQTVNDQHEHEHDV